MREGWESRPLGDVLRQIQRPVSVADLDLVPFAGVRWYAEGVYHRDDPLASTVKTKTLNRIVMGDIVYNRMWATKASFGVVGDDAAGCLVTNDFPIFEASEAVLPGFVGLLFQWRAFQTAAAAAATGTTERRRLHEIEFVKIRMPIPPLPDQRRIVDLIGALDYSIDRLGECTAAAMQAHDAVRRYLLAGTPEWSQKRIGEVAQAVTGRAFPARFQGRAAGIYPYIKCSDMNADGQELVMSEAANWIDDSVSDQLGAKILPTGTVIFPILGAALATEKRRVLGLPAAFDQNVMGLVPGPLITSDFLLAVMSETSLARLSQQGAVPSVNQSIVSSIAIPLPSLDEQRRIGGVLAASAEGVRKARQAAAALRAVREHALGSLLSGEHEIPESYDELMGVAS